MPGGPRIGKAPTVQLANGVEDYSLLETFHGGQGRYSRAEDSLGVASTQLSASKEQVRASFSIILHSFSEHDCCGDLYWLK